MRVPHTVDNLRARCVVADPTGCWLWAGRKMRNGYGQVIVAGKNVLTHRRMWQLAFGPIPEGLFVCHRCDVRNCIAPHHLFLGTNLENMHDMIAKGRDRKRPLHGEAAPLSEMTDAQVVAARSCVDGGMTVTSVARLLGVGRSAVSLAITGRHYAHLPGPLTARRRSTQAVLP